MRMHIGVFEMAECQSSTAFAVPAASTGFRVGAVEQGELETLLLSAGSLIQQVCFAFSAMARRSGASDKLLFCKHSLPFPPRWL